MWDSNTANVAISHLDAIIIGASSYGVSGLIPVVFGWEKSL